MIWELSGQQQVVTFSFACAMSFICGWIADRIMGAAGFGVIGNWLLLLAGTYVGLFAYNRLGYALGGDAAATILVAFGGATVMLVMLAGIKAVTHT